MQCDRFNGVRGTDGDDVDPILFQAHKLRRLDHGAGRRVSSVLAGESTRPHAVGESSGDEEGPSRLGDSERSGNSGDDEASDAFRSDDDVSIRGSSDRFSTDRFSDEEFSDDDLSDDEFSVFDYSNGFSCNTVFESTSMTIDYANEYVCGISAGVFVRFSDKLRKLVVDGKNMEWNPMTAEGRRTHEWFLHFCRGVAGNRSIRRLSLRGCGMDSWMVMAALLFFIRRNSNLRTLEILGSNFAGCNLGYKGARILASSLVERADKPSLRRVVLDANDIGDESGKNIVNALRGYDNLAVLSLGDNELGPATCEALAALLADSKARLKSLNLENNQIDDAGIASLTRALTKNSTLRDLNLSFSCGVSQAGWSAFAACLTSPTSALRALDLSSTNIADEGARALGRALVRNKSLVTLDMYDIADDGVPLITSSGWRSIFACLKREDCKLEHLDLRYGSVDEDGLPALSDALACNASLTTLDLSNNKQVPAEGWRSLFSVLGRPGSSLEEVRLRGSLLSDAEVEILAERLHGDEKLLTLDLGASSAVTEAGWAHLANLLCDASSATALHASNHTLRSLGGEPSVPSELDELLLLNARGDPRDVAREKALRYRFADGRKNAHELVDMGAGALPRALSWAGRGGAAGRTLLFEALRGMPSLVANAGAVRAAGGGGKRKREL